ncbi:aspartate/glutamate racemase family protein [Mesobacterium pallidum]|uniref:aspartate/glutamate racemase family protein n=1 Tax=Mesobacterium pallidum TaxID=2872037 RepID=UPI001EE37DC8|nr:aspartate/glutamate racemase family protein [Mesobacterium pallidum]
MAVVLINPNSTEAMTTSALAAARAASPGIAFEGWTSRLGPPAIEGAEDGEAAIPPLLDLVRKASDEGAEAIIIACFDDTGLDAARAMAACPVVGIGEASYIMAGLMPGQAAVITTVAAALPVITGNIAAQGHAHRVGEVIAANVPVLTLEHDPEAAAREFTKATERLQTAPSTIILGCAGAVTIVDRLNAALPYTFMDGVSAAARLCRAFT